jgi:predicted nucleic acid-binding protein
MLTEGAAISVVTYGEVMEGVMYAQHRALAMQRFREFLEPIDIIGITTDIAEIWADIRGHLRRTIRGRTFADNDLMIAATALRFDLTLITRNLKDFEPIEGLTITTSELEATPANLTPARVTD